MEGVGSVLDGLLVRREWRAGVQLGHLARRWAEVVGDELAGRTTPVRLDETGTLTVRASSAAWAAQVGFLGREVAAAANRALGREAVRTVRTVVDPGPAGEEGPGAGGQRW